MRRDRAGPADRRHLGHARQHHGARGRQLHLPPRLQDLPPRRHGRGRPAGRRDPARQPRRPLPARDGLRPPAAPRPDAAHGHRRPSDGAAPGDDASRRRRGPASWRPPSSAASRWPTFPWPASPPSWSRTATGRPPKPRATASSNAAWAERAEFVYRHEPIGEAIRRAKGVNDAPVVLLDHADNVGSGGSADSMTVIRELIRQGVTDVAVAAVWDPEAVRAMREAGPGATLTLDLGGRTEMPSIGARAEPLRLTGKVRSLSDGEWIVRGPMYTGAKVTTGPTAVFDAARPDDRRHLRPPRALGRRHLHQQRHRPAPLPLPPAQEPHPLPRRLRARSPRRRSPWTGSG